MLRLDPGTSITDSKQDVAASGYLKTLLWIGHRELEVLRFEEQFAATGHRVASIDRQVQHYLLHLHRIDVYGSEVWCEGSHQLNFLSEDTPEHVFDRRQHRV